MPRSKKYKGYVYLCNPDWSVAETKAYKSKVRKRKRATRDKRDLYLAIARANKTIDKLDEDIWIAEDWVISKEKHSSEETVIMVHDSDDEDEALDILMTMQERMGDDIGIVSFKRGPSEAQLASGNIGYPYKKGVLKPRELFPRPKPDLKCHENRTEALGPSQLPMNKPEKLTIENIEIDRPFPDME